MIPALLQIAPAFGGVAEIEGVRGAKSRSAIKRTLNFIERNNKFPRSLFEAVAGNYPATSVQIASIFQKSDQLTKWTSKSSKI